MMVNKNKGFTLAEVVISFVLVSIIGLLVGHTFTSAYVMSSKLEEIPKKYYEAQKEIENEISILSDNINECYILENEMSGKSDDEIKQEDKERYNELVASLNNYSKQPIELFGKKVDLYTFRNEDADTKIVAGGVNFVSHNHSIPIIKSVSINSGDLDSYDMFEESYNPSESINNKIYAQVVMDTKNKSSLDKIVYEWYICDDRYHSVPFIEGYKYTSSKFLNAYPLFPNGFKHVDGLNELENYFKIDDDDYYNRFLVCVATPISKDGSAGIPKVSNYVYISGLPTTVRDSQYSGKNLIEMVIDPSLESVNYTDDERVELNEIYSRYNYGENNVKLYAQGTNYPKLNLVGAMTNSEHEYEADDQYYSRYIEFDNNSSMKTKNLNGISGSTYLFLVARDRNNEKNDFVFLNSESYGFDNDSDNIIMTDPGDEGWRIIRIYMKYDRHFNGIVFGKSNVDIAEIIMTRNSRNFKDYNERMIEYLSEKYNIDVDEFEQELD